MTRNVYLGRTVKDTRKKGLDNLREVRDIVKAIVRDRKKHKISEAKAQKRLNLLKLIIKKNKKLTGKKRKAYKIIEQGRKQIK